MKAGTENLDTGATTLGSRRRFLKLGAAAVLARSLADESRNYLFAKAGSKLDIFSS